ncbi:HDOD domain-containing protein [Rhodobacteraceae bacterium CH30]|nr:HDOD domain-containing protein [Rhodobacteraceae bacterium CH30]
MNSISTFIGRQPVTDRQQQIIAYELLFRRDESSTDSGLFSPLEADTRVLTGILGDIGSGKLLKNKLAFVNVGETMLMSELVELLPARKIVLELSGDLPPSREILDRMRMLRGQGFSFSLDCTGLESGNEAYFDQIRYAKIDIQHETPQQFMHMNAQLKSYPILRIAKRVETPAHYSISRELDMDAYQGFYFAKPETVSATTIHPGMVNTLRLLNLVRNDADADQIEAVLKTDLALSFKLLRFVNSAAAGQHMRITSFSHAIIVLGYRKLYRWLTLLLVSNDENGRISPSLQRTAIIRARLMENIGRQQGLNQDGCDLLFISGMFSLLDVILKVPMLEACRHLQLPQEVEATLQGKPGTGASLLSLVRALEAPELGKISYLADAISMPAAQLNELHIEALGWVEDLGL